MDNAVNLHQAGQGEQPLTPAQGHRRWLRCQRALQHDRLAPQADAFNPQIRLRMVRCVTSGEPL